MKKILIVCLSLLLAVNYLFAQGVDKPQYRIATYRAGNFLGNIDIELFPLIAPNHTRNFDSLAVGLLFDSTAFHRVVPGFVIQGGDPNTINGPMSTWGNGNANQVTVNAEFSVAQHLRGRIGAARDANINSANSQFYICVGNALFLDGQYTVFGQTIAGMDIADSIVNSPRDANDIPLQKITMFVTPLGSNASIPSAPSLTLPVDQATAVPANQLFKWSLVSDAVIYTAEFSRDSTFATIDDSVNAGVTQVPSPALLSSTKYFWRVKSNNGGHESSYSNVFSFTTLFGTPSLISPSNLANNIITSPTLTWSSVAGNVTYNLLVATSSSFSAPFLVYNQSGIIDTTMQLNGLLPNTMYYWKVCAADSTTTGNFPLRFSFKTAAATGINDITGDLIIGKVYPNPATEQLNISLSLNAASSVEFSINDLQGKLMQTESRQISDLKQVAKIDVSKIPSGNYILNVETETEIFSYRIQIK